MPRHAIRAIVIAGLGGIANAAVVPRCLLADVFGSPDSYVHIAILGEFAVGLAVVWLLEALLRSRVRDWNGGGFVGRTDAG